MPSLSTSPISRIFRNRAAAQGYGIILGRERFFNIAGPCNPAKHYMLSATDRLGVGEGWLVVFDPDMAKPWDEKISHEDRVVDGKTIHLFFC